MYTLKLANAVLFLSTLSLRRATRANRLAHAPPEISIHALLAESDSVPHWPVPRQQKFLSTLSLRRATFNPPTKPFKIGISIHALLAESDALIHSKHS